VPIAFKTCVFADILWFFVGCFPLIPGGRFSLFIGLISLEISRLSIHFDAEKAVQIRAKHFDFKLTTGEENWFKIVEILFN
jgi:hypothetical protein